ncbi:MAG: hypothetical protein U0521_21760 [Anaerolineae bacterium]
MSSTVRRDSIILIAAVLMAALYLAAAGGNFPLDDSWIHQTYGRNLAEYGEWAFLPACASAASTSPLYTVVLSVGYRLGIEFHVRTHGLGTLALALTGMIGARRNTSHRRTRCDRAGAQISAAGHRAGAGRRVASDLGGGLRHGDDDFQPVLAAADPAGMARDRTAQPRRARRDRARGGVRHDGGAGDADAPGRCAAGRLIGLALLIVRPNMTWRSLIVWGGAALVCYAIVLAPYLIFNYRVTGGLLPNTAAAKRMESAPYLARDYLWRLGNVLTPLAAGAQLLLIPGMAAYLAFLPRARRSILLALPLIWAAALILLYAATLPLDIQHGRYVIPALLGAITTA